jgi:cobalt transport protein ATP-binding subunit
VHHTVEIENLWYSYPDGHLAINNVSLKIGPDEKVALVGPNGAGKSTLMMHLNGLLFPTSGSVRVGGLSVTQENLYQIRAWVGLVFQNPDDQLFNSRVMDDVAFGPLHMNLTDAEVHDRSRDALDAVGMSGYEERISHHLSLGEKKRIAIATVLSMEPKILVLDEPTGGLDPRARRSLMNLLDSMVCTMLVASHDMRMVAECFPRTLILDEGRIVADGSTESLMENVQLLADHGLEKP